MTQSRLGFIPEPITVAFEKLLPSRKQPEGLALSRKFKQIVASIDAIGLIEPLTIAKADKATGMHLLLDGHIRMFALQELGFSSALCLIASIAQPTIIARRSVNLDEIRCKNCNKRLGVGIFSKLFIKCPRCHRLNNFSPREGREPLFFKGASLCQTLPNPSKIRPEKTDLTTGLNSG